MNMARIVLDTNSLIMCIPRRSRYHDLWLSFLDGRNQLCVSNEILNEYAEILEQKTSAVFAERVMDVITNSKNILRITPYYHFAVITADPDDNKFVDCAVAANATCIVTEDRHYNILEDVAFPHIKVINIDEAMLLLNPKALA